MSCYESTSRIDLRETDQLLQLTDIQISLPRCMCWEVSGSRVTSFAHRFLASIRSIRWDALFSIASDGIIDRLEIRRIIMKTAEASFLHQSVLHSQELRFPQNRKRELNRGNLPPPPRHYNIFLS